MRSLLTFLIVMCVIETGWAAGTRAGTIISNQATVTFSIGTTTYAPVKSNLISFVVSQIASINVTPVSATSVSTINTLKDYAFKATNSGNGPDQCSLQGVTTKGFNVLFYKDLNGNGVLDSLEVVAGAIATTSSLEPDSSIALVARVQIPNDPSLNGTSDILTVTAASTFNTSKAALGSYTTQIRTSAFVMTKSVNNNSPTPWSHVTYTIAYSNPNGGVATNVVVTDILNSNLMYLNGSATPAPSTVSAQRVQWNLGSVNGGASGTITFDVNILNGVATGTEIHNVATASYNDGPNTKTPSSTETNFIVVGTGGQPTVSISPASYQSEGEPGDTIVYAHTITNNGSGAESFDLAFNSSSARQWKFFQDLNGNRKIDVGEPAVITTGPINGAGTFALLAMSTLGKVSGGRSLDISRFWVTSALNSNNAAKCEDSIWVNMPVMNLAKTVSATEAKVGTVVVYTITYSNIGSGRALSFKVVDQIPANTTYVAGSTKLNSVPKTDGPDGDEVTVVNGTITVILGTILPAVSGAIEFSVRIN